MLATADTGHPVAFGGMRNRLHAPSPQETLARNLSAAFRKRGWSARSAAIAIAKTQGVKMSNKTVSNMLNGEGNPQMEGLVAVAKLLKISLWQLLCPGLEISQVDDQDVHDLLETFTSLSELGRRGAQRHIKGQLALEIDERAAMTHSNKSDTQA